MAAATAVALGGLAISGYQAIDGANRAKKASKELSEYERQTLDNAFENIQISTMGSDLLKEQAGITSASLVDSAQQSGTRGILSTLPKIVGYTNNVNQEAAKMLDDQVQRRSYAIAGDNARIEGITENRDIANISALSSEVNAGRQDTANGIMGGLSSLGYGLSNFGGFTPQVDSVMADGLTPAGLTGTTPTANVPYGLNNKGFTMFQPEIRAEDPTMKIKF